ncbi:hypothetical protein J2X46_003717 [Nocardioides sp. BE266]|uniref:DUF4082 domain-containing protein n=1 Tax=Nocardioides sp. BE266 TaxID=2817725 RepID=UPI002865AC2F|nr:DUF4082 domain-containing protein [Nocardioides sp. BE266]MDR7254719.1 hypothetical protein [Nocardioides sp. BE266]
MRIRTAISALAGVVLASVAVLPSTAAPSTVSPRAQDRVALWGTTFSAGLKADDCGRWKLDDEGFCTANDWRNGVELGTRFVTSRPVSIVGVRVYRIDPANVTGSLWDGLGNRIATGTFERTTKKGWQDLLFAAPVTITPGQTYIASYYTPATKYAFQYNYFERSATRGPITALRATDTSPNGVHCYDVAPCTYPSQAFRSSNYWVTPLWQELADPIAPTPTPTPTTPAALVPPVVHTSAPGAGATKVNRGAKIKVTFSKKVRPATLTRMSVHLHRKGKAARVPVRLSYDARRARLTLVPKMRLRPGTTYRVVVTSKVLDTFGNRLDQDPDKPGIQRATWTFRTR